MLVACVGNIFLSDDGFGVEVARRMAGEELPVGVVLADFGIRGVHLAYELLEGYDTLVLVDAAPRGLAPGTVTLVAVDQSRITDAGADVMDGQMPLVDAHGLEPGAILRILASLGGRVAQVLLIACEPLTVEEGIGLSPEVSAAVEPAVALVRQVVHEREKYLKEVSR